MIIILILFFLITIISFWVPILLGSKTKVTKSILRKFICLKVFSGLGFQSNQNWLAPPPLLFFLDWFNFWSLYNAVISDGEASGLHPSFVLDWHLLPSTSMSRVPTTLASVEVSVFPPGFLTHILILLFVVIFSHHDHGSLQHLPAFSLSARCLVVRGKRKSCCLLLLPRDHMRLAMAVLCLFPFQQQRDISALWIHFYLGY